MKKLLITILLTIFPILSLSTVAFAQEDPYWKFERALFNKGYQLEWVRPRITKGYEARFYHHPMGDRMSIRRYYDTKNDPRDLEQWVKRLQKCDRQK
jgi:hypothetical protein